MVLLVPFDGSALSETALRRADEFAKAFDDEVVVLSVIPPDEECARARGWVGHGEEFVPARVAADLEERALEIAPDATFRWERTEDTGSMRATVTMDVVRTIRRVAHEVDASIVFIGSENAGRVSTPVTSVGDPVSEDPRYDVHIVRHPD